jgi:hypothetical protein
MKTTHLPKSQGSILTWSKQRKTWLFPLFPASNRLGLFFAEEAEFYLRNIHKKRMMKSEYNVPLYALGQNSRDEKYIQTSIAI